MRIIIAIGAVVLSGLASAQTYRPFETTDELRQRRSSENYDTYRNNGNQAPAGGYREPLGSPSPRGTERPGYERRDTQSNQNNRRSGRWQE